MSRTGPTLVTVGLASVLALTTAPVAHAVTVSVSADDYTVTDYSTNQYQTCVMHTFDMTAEYAEGEAQRYVYATVTDPEGAEVHRLRTTAANQEGIEMVFCRPVILEGTYTITATLGDPVRTARQALVGSDTFVVTVDRAQPAATPPPAAPSVQALGVAKTRPVRDGFRVKFIGGANVTTRFTVKVDGRVKRAVTVRAGDTKVKTYEGARRVRVRAAAA